MGSNYRCTLTSITDNVEDFGCSEVLLCRGIVCGKSGALRDFCGNGAISGAEVEGVCESCDLGDRGSVCS